MRASQSHAVAAALNISVLLFAPSSAGAFRTSAELPGIAGQPFRGWSRATGPTSIQYELGEASPTLGYPAFDSAAVQAFSRWSSAGCGAVQAVSLGHAAASHSLGDGRNTIRFELDDWSAFPEDAVASTQVIYAWDPTQNAWIMVEADIHLNAVDYTWSENGSATSLSAAVALTHEIGHLLGILHPCELDNQALMCGATDVGVALMYPDYAGITNPALRADDRAAFCSIYPGVPPACEGTLCADGSCRPSPETCPDVIPPAGGDFGEPCEYGTDCRGLVCLEDESGTYCSMGCSSGMDCPSGALCHPVEGERACVVSQSTCSASPQPTSAPFAPLLLLLVAVIYRRQGNKSR